jgi:hypothetical protein
MTAATSQAEFAAKAPEGKMGQRTVLQIGIHLLNNGVFPVDLVRRDGVQDRSVHGGEERVVPVGFEKGGLSAAGFRFSSGMRRTTRRPVICSACLRELNAVNTVSATSAFETQVSVYSIVSHAVSGISAAPPGSLRR